MSDEPTERDVEALAEAIARVEALADEYALTGSPYLIQRDVIVADLRAALRSDA